MEDNRATAELSTVKTVSDKHEARVAEVQKELKDAVTKCENLEQKNKGQATKLSKIKQEIQRRGRKGEAPKKSSAK